MNKWYIKLKAYLSGQSVQSYCSEQAFKWVYEYNKEVVDENNHFVLARWGSIKGKV